MGRGREREREREAYGNERVLAQTSFRSNIAQTSFQRGYAALDRAMGGSSDTEVAPVGRYRTKRYNWTT